MKRVLYIGLLLLVGLLTLEGCIKEDNPVVAETRNISMTMNVDTRAGGSDINVDIESAINTLRVYAFYGERKVGYFYGNDKNLVVDGGKLSFSMDLFGLFPFRSPLLRKSIFLSFPPVTKMFQFTGLLSV